MTTNYEYTDEDDDIMDNNDGGITQLRKVNRALEKRAKELEKELMGIKTQSRQRTIKDVLQARGANPKIAAFIPADIDPSEDAVSAWLTEYGDVFGYNPEATKEEQAPTKDLSANQRISNVVSTGQVPTIDEDAFSKIMAAMNPEALDQILGVQR
jgi:hypothetical protein